jgi:acetoin utilization protein AcuB
MYVVRNMSSPPVTVKPDLPIPTVREILQSHQFRHMPIVDDNGSLVGMVTDRDLRSAYPSLVLEEVERTAALSRLSETPIAAIMTRDPIFLRPEATLDDALFLFDRHKMGALPVVNSEGTVMGMFSIRDLIRAFKELFGLGERGSALIEIEDDGQPQILTRIVQALENRNVPFTRLVRTPADETEAGKGVIYLRVHTFNVHSVHDILRATELRINPRKLADSE